jgi:hypothetical protein
MEEQLIRCIWDLRFSGDDDVDRGLLGLDALKMEAISSSETLIATYKATRRHNPDDHNR